MGIKLLILRYYPLNQYFLVMSKISYLFLIAVFSFSLHSCDQLKPGNKKSGQENKESTGTKDKTTLRKSHYPNGKLMSEVNYRNGKKHGLAKNYYQNGNLKLKLYYENGVKHGLGITYYESGKKYRETTYVNGKIDGIRKVYREGGALMAEIPYKNGHVGKGLKEYLLNGKPKTKFPYLIVKTVDNRVFNDEFLVQVYFSEKSRKPEFYVGQLTDGKYLNDDLQKLQVIDGKGTMYLRIHPGSMAMKTLYFTGKTVTRMRSPYLTSKSYNLSIEP